ncbi:unnamed protein product [Darwinula stevensoni]|uniref:Kringle domain-containing protein n=1 Tax=Darwinula stevensoni TaxID=69355 RepID=A0A7R8XH69_9CRUS|nr:unnamed protein product [Darwinula stevensoni]CAG0892468.1 unnamed protein product [Darwinula stevensoni]
MASKSKKYRAIKKEIRDVLSTLSGNGEPPAKVCLLANESVHEENLDHLQNQQHTHIKVGDEEKGIGNILEEAAEGKNVKSLPAGTEEEKETSMDKSIPSHNSQSTLTSSLRQWAVKSRVPHTSLTSLLSILRCHGHPELPHDGRTLLQTLRNVDVKKLGDGEFVYLGIEQDNYHAAHAHLKKAEETSDLNSEHEEKRKRKPTCRYSPPASKKRKRVVRKTRIISDSSTSSSSECISDNENMSIQRSFNAHEEETANTSVMQLVGSRSQHEELMEPQPIESLPIPSKSLPSDKPSEGILTSSDGQSQLGTNLINSSSTPMHLTRISLDETGTRQVIALLVSIKHNILQQGRRLDNMEIMIQGLMDGYSHLPRPQEPQSIVNTLNLALPIITLEDFHLIDERLNSPDVRESMVETLALIGGHNLADCTNRILRALLSNELASQMSIHGRKLNKIPFIKTNFFELVFDAVRRNPRLTNPTQKDYEEKLGKWLKNAQKRLKLRCRNELGELGWRVPSPRGSRHRFHLLCGTFPTLLRRVLDAPDTLSVSLYHMAYDLREEKYPECLLTKKGREYIGTMNRTKSGRDCLRWDAIPYGIPDDFVTDLSVNPLREKGIPFFWVPEMMKKKTMECELNFLGFDSWSQMNYCRNPTQKEGPWFDESYSKLFFDLIARLAQESK